MSATAEQLFEDAAVRIRFLAHQDDLRGKVRSEVVRRHLQAVILDTSTAALRVLDVGCGDGRDSLWLAAMGHDVIGIDPAEAMLELALARHADIDLPGSVRFERGDVDAAIDSFGPEQFDLVLSHGVLMYHDDPSPFVAKHIELLRPHGVLSLLAKNADALAHRAAREASIDEAIRLLDESNGVGHLGVATSAQTIQELADMGFAAGATVRSWAGVRLFSDSPTESLLDADHDKVIELEWRAARRDPHRRTASLLHVLFLKGVDLSLLPA